MMRTALLLFAVIIAEVNSICNSTTFWNPLNNACVNQCPWQSPNIYYADPSTRQCVVTCPTTPSYYANDFIQTCVYPCPWNATLQTYYDDYYRRCVLACPSSPSYYALNLNTDGKCVQYCPNGTFSLDSNRSCVTNCPLYYFVNYTLNVIQYQCVATCPKNTFVTSVNNSGIIFNYCVNATSCPNNTYGDIITGQCTTDCTHNNGSIQTYSDTNPNVKLCVYVCPKNFYRQNLPTNHTCVSTCISNYFIDYINLICVSKCPNGTYSYVNGSCVSSCPNGFYADDNLNMCNTTCANNRFRDVVNNFCVTMCPPGYFGDIVGGYICTLTCSNSTSANGMSQYGDPVTRLCVTNVNCTSPYIYADDYSKRCVTLCPISQNTYGDANASYCALNCTWGPTLYTFRDPSTQTCVTKCPINPSLYADNTTFTCVPSCPGSYYAVDATRTCELSCPANFYINTVTKSCVSTCPTNPVFTYHYANATNASQCLEICPVNFLADPTTMTCINTTCPSSPALFAFNKTCISVCPNGTFANSDPAFRTCDSNCTGIFLMDPSTSRCVKVCPANPKLFADWTTNTCVSLCPSTYFADNSTRTCVQVCNQSVGYLAYTPLRLCVLTCPNNTFSYNGTCITICPNASAPYFYIDTTTKSCVTSCPDYYFKDDFLGQCVQLGACSNGYYADHSIRTCVQYCNSSLFIYRDNTTMSCVTQCPFGTFGDNSTTGQKICSLICPDGWFSDSSTWTCVQTCPTNPSYYADLTSKTCIPVCRQELDQYAYDVNRTCVNQCPANTSADIYTRRCLLNCLLVPSTYLYVNGTLRECVLQCPIGQFADNSTRSCVDACPSTPNYFADWLSRTCVSLCPWTSTTKYYADNETRTCVMTCPNGTNGNITFRDTVLRICMPVCSGNQFADNSTGNCVQVCPTTPDYFGQMSNKTCVLNCDPVQLTFAQNITRLCVQVCPAGSYADNTTQRCVAKCPVSQLYYGDNSTHTCVKTCPSYPQFYADNTTQLCVPICPGFTYGAPVSRVCQYPKNCSSGYFADNFTKLCVTNCPPTQGSYADSVSKYCIRRCPVGSFADNSTYTCVPVCPQTPSYFGYQEKCLASCPNNTYADTPSRLCVISTNCTNLTWGDPTSQKCVSVCPFNYYADMRNQTKMCVQLCPQGYYADDYTKSCVVQCPAANFTYGQNATRKCVEVCPNLQFAENSTRMCMSNCPNGSYADANVRVCVAVCSATPNLYGNPVNNTCVYTCPSIPDLYAQNSSRLCLPDCPFNQSTFADRLTRRCVLTCPVSGFTYADNYTRRCQINCTYNTTINVLTYADNSTLTCVALCPSVPQYYADISTGTGLCVPFCPNNTSPRIFSDNSTRICMLTCNLSLFYYSSNTTGQCVVVCPGGFFADNVSQACVSRCPGRVPINASYALDTFGYEFSRTCVDFCVGVFFAQNSSRLCVLSCPQLQYADSLLHRCVSACDGQRRQYADNSTNRCVPICPLLPDTFADNSTYTCVSPCPMPNAIGYNCTNTCPIGTWADNMTRECKPFCAQNTTLLPQFADNYTGRCVQFCPRNLFTYADMVTKACVIMCPDANITNNVTITNRTFADDSTKRCVEGCPSNPWTFAENTTRRCVFKCPNNSFGENNTRQCVENCTLWGSFADNSTTFCVATCPKDSFADNSSMRCVANCPPGTYADNSTWRCVQQCPSNPALYGDPTSAVCVINCPNNLYGDDQSRVCLLQCPRTPKMTYAYDLTHRCYINCLYPYFGQPNNNTPTYGTCQTYCFTGQYANMTTHLCQPCKLQCTKCVSLLGCQACISGYYLFNGTCLSGCISGSVSTGDCKSACPFNNITQTITYADSKSQSCVQICPILNTGGSFGYNITLTCVISCPINYYSSTITRRCELCVDGCNNCTSPTVCFNCYPGFIFSKSLCVKQCSLTLPFYYGTTCLASCIDGTYLMTDLVTCGACSSICLTCSKIASNCTKCVGMYLYNYNCVSKCPDNYYADDGLCKVCTANTTQCNVPALTYTLKANPNAGGDGNYLQSILTFNRDVDIAADKIKQAINISLPGIPSNVYTWTATKTSGNTYTIKVYSTVSLNQLSLSLTFTNPSLVIDPLGGSLTTTTATAPLPTFDYISPQVKASTKSAASFSTTLSWVALAIMMILIFKGSYYLLIASQVFQMLIYHYFIGIALPYNYSYFLIGLSALNFQFLPNILTSIVPAGYASSSTPSYFVKFITDTTFFISSGQYMVLILIYASFAILISLLKNKGINKYRKLRKFAKGIFQKRIRYGAINECLWFCFISFTFFGFWQLKDLTVSGSWSYANIFISILCWMCCILLSTWVIHLSLKYKDDASKVPKKYGFILGQDSHIPFEMPLRHIRKILFCIFLVIGTIQTQIIAMIGANFMMLSYYLFFKPAKSRFSNWTHILIELCYIGLEITIILFNNEINLTTEMKLTYGTAMMAFSLTALLLVVIWLVWQFLLFLYDFKFVRDVIEQTKLANQIYPQEDNLKVQFDRQYEKDQIIQESISDGGEPQQHFQEQTVQGIEKQYNQVVHYVEQGDSNKKKGNKGKGQPQQIENTSSNISESNEPRLISSRASSRMLFADLNIEDIE